MSWDRLVLHAYIELLFFFLLLRFWRIFPSKSRLVVYSAQYELLYIIVPKCWFINESLLCSRIGVRDYP